MRSDQIRTRVEREVRQNPDIKGWRDEFFDRLNDAMDELLTLEDWQFRQRLKTLRFKAEVDLTTSYTTNAGSNTYAISFTEPSDWDAVDTELLAGHTASFTAGTGAGLTADYVIERASISSSTITIILDPRFGGHTTVGAADTLKIKFFRYRLPPDVEEVYGIQRRDSKEGHMREISLARESRLILKNTDGPNTPQFFLLDPNVRTAYDTLSGEYYPHDFIPAPINPPTLTEAATGALTLLGTYEYCYAHYYAGLVSEPSPIETVTLTGTNQTVSVTAMDSFDANRGRGKYLFRREIFSSREGPWYMVSDITASNTATAADAGAFTPVADPTTITRLNRYDSLGSLRFVRTWPLTNADLTAELRYLARIPRCTTDADVPEMPGAYHIILVHLIAEKLSRSFKSQSLADYHNNKVYGPRGLLETMKQRHIVSSSQRVQRNSMLNGGAGGLVLQEPSYTSDA